MAKKKRPTHEIPLGSVRATIWANRSSRDGVDWYSVTTSRCFKDAQGKWRNTYSFEMRHLPELVQAIEKASQWIELNSESPAGRELRCKLVEAVRENSPKRIRRAA